ncbi:hypothetical protein Tco_0375542 [Tanacetum coccineum]
MTKTRDDCGSGIARPKFNDKAHFELKGQFLKELRDNTFSGLDNEDANEHIEKVLEIVGLFHIPDVTENQIMLRVFPMSITGAANRWLRNEPDGSIDTWADLFVRPPKVESVNVQCLETPQRMKTKVIALIKRLEFVLGNSLFSMQGDKLETVFQIRNGPDVSSIRLNMETLAPRLFCIQFFIIHAMIEGRIKKAGQWNMFSAENSAQFENNLAERSLSEVKLKGMMIILNNSDCGETYNSKYKDACELLIFFPNCGVFAMIHMESYIGEPVTRWDVGLCWSVYRDKMFDLTYKFETDNDEYTRISIIVNAIKNRVERDPVKNVVENQEGDAVKNVFETQEGDAVKNRK